MVKTISSNISQVVFKCQIDCVPPPKVQWFKDGTEITKDARVKCYKVTKLPKRRRNLEPRIINVMYPVFLLLRIPTGWIAAPSAAPVVGWPANSL